MSDADATRKTPADRQLASSGTGPRRRLRRDLAVGAAAMGFAAAVVLVQLVSWGGDPTSLLRVGRYAPARPYIERSFPQPRLTEDYGHDGQQFYVLASAFPDLESAAPYVDNIRYRARRIVFVALASPFPDGAPLVWAMFGLNLLAIGAAGAALAELASRLRAPPAIGVVAGLSPALIESLQGSLGDATAFALALWGIVLWRRHLWWAIALFSLAALTRETTLVVPLACMVVGDNRSRLRLAVPFAVFACWMLLVAWWLPVSEAGGQSIWADATDQLSWPGNAWIQLGLGAEGTLTAMALIVSGACAALVFRRSLAELSWWLVLDLVLVALSDSGVTERPFNIVRVAPLAIPALLLAIFASRGDSSRTDSGRGLVGAR